MCLKEWYIGDNVFANRNEGSDQLQAVLAIQQGLAQSRRLYL